MERYEELETEQDLPVKKESKKAPTQQELDDVLNKEISVQAIGDFLRKVDYAGRKFPVFVSSVAPSSFDNKLVLGISFDGEDKQLTLGAKNLNDMIKATGSRKPKDWIGKHVQLEFSELRDFEIKGENVPGVQLNITAVPK